MDSRLVKPIHSDGGYDKNKNRRNENDKYSFSTQVGDQTMHSIHTIIFSITIVKQYANGINKEKPADNK